MGNATFFRTYTVPIASIIEEKFLPPAINQISNCDELIVTTKASKQAELAIGCLSIL